MLKLVTKNNVILLLIVTIVALCIFLVVKSDSSDDSKHTLDKLNKQISVKEKKIQQLTAESDSILYSLKVLEEDYHNLQMIKSDVKTTYRKVYVYIDHATNKQLDSLIRTNW